MPPDPRSLCPLSSTEFVEPPPRKKFLDTPLNPAALKWKNKLLPLEGGHCLNQTATFLTAAFSWPYTHSFCTFRPRNSFTENTQSMRTSKNASPSPKCRKIDHSYWIMVYHNKRLHITLKKKKTKFVIRKFCYTIPTYKHRHSRTQ